MEGWATHDTIFLAVVSLLTAIVASPVLVAMANRWLRRDSAVQALRAILIEVREINRKLHKRDPDE